ncbi:MAG: L,D-transpeptidase family protein [Flavipsychrobacter sp.]
MALISCHSRSGKSGSRERVIASAPDKKEFAERLSGLFPDMDSSDNKKHIHTIAENMRYAYELNEYAPIWLSHSKPNDETEKFLSELDNIRWDGIDPEKYHLSQLKQMHDGFDDKNTDVNYLINFDTTFTNSYLHAAHDLLMGELVPKTVDSLWYHKNDSSWTAPEHLATKDSDFPSLDVYRSKVPTYKLLKDQYQFYAKLQSDSTLMAAIEKLQGGQTLKKHDSAITYIITTEMPWANNESDTMSAWQQMVENYQYYNDIKASGKLDSFTLARLARTPQQINDEIRLNMERVRWMQQNIGDQYIVVDVPVMELFFRRGGETVMHMRTVVGKPERQTPSLDANMANVVINPPWGVPPTIMKKDVLPGMSKSGMKYLKKKGLKVYDHNGNVVDASEVNESNYKRFIFRQAPGDDNALGYVKFNLPNKWDIYLHDTPHRDDFPKRNRFLSSGCIRLEQPQQMALYILGTLENKRYTQERLDSVIQTHKTRWEILKTKIPVHIVYLTVFEDTTGQHLRFIRDIYHRDDRVLAALK